MISYGFAGGDAKVIRDVSDRVKGADMRMEGVC
jgi:hypothetical protein